MLFRCWSERIVERWARRRLEPASWNRDNGLFKISFALGFAFVKGEADDDPSGQKDEYG